MILLRLALLYALLAASALIVCFTLGLIEAGLRWLWDVTVRGRRLVHRRCTVMWLWILLAAICAIALFEGSVIVVLLYTAAGAADRADDTADVEGAGAA